MNFIIFNSLLGVLLMLAGTFKFFQDFKRIKTLAYLCVGISTFICLNNFLDLNILPNWVFVDLKFRQPEWLFIFCMEFCFALFLLFNFDEIKSINRPLNEQLALLFFIFSGCALLVSYQNLLTLFLGIEIVSIPLYIITGIDKHNLKGNEAALKYFLLGAVSTCILLMGICLIYGATGFFDMENINAVVTSLAQKNTKNYLLIAGILFIVVALSFKVSAAPFHYWTPDVYEGAHIVYTSFMATIVKSFFIIAFFKIFSSDLINLNIVSLKYPTFIIISLTLIIGNFTAVFQKGLKRFMAYSSISQVGFMLIAIFNSKFNSADALFLYTIMYSITSISIFAIIAKSENQSTENLKGLQKQYPLIALTFTIYLLSLAGIPLTSGFLAKYTMIEIAVKSSMPLYILLIIIISGAISAFYYLRIVQDIYFKERSLDIPIFTGKINNTFNYLLVLTSLIIIILGIKPHLLLNLLMY